MKTDPRIKTYRPQNCKKSVTWRVAKDRFDLEDHRTLDFGCGKDAYWPNHLAPLGLEVEGCDLSRPDLKPTGKFDLIVLSNVVNVQESRIQLSSLANAIAAYAADSFVLVWNYPSSPRKAGWSIKQAQELFLSKLLASGFGEVKHERIKNKNCFVTNFEKV